MRTGWQEKFVGDILQLEYGKPLDESSRKADGRFPVYGANGEKDRTDKFYHDKPSIIVGRKGSAGEINLTEQKFWPLDVTYYVTFDERQHDLRFLYYLLTTLELTKLAKGVKPGINRNEVYSKRTKVPSLTEQRRVVSILDETFEGIGCARGYTEKNQENARALFEGHLNQIFAQRGEGWTSTNVGELVDKAILEPPLDGNHGEIHPKKADFVSFGVPFIMASDLYDGLVDEIDCAFISEKQAASLRKGFAKNGDVLLSHKGTIGRVAILHTERPYVMLTPQVTYYRITAKKILLNRFLYYVFQAPQFLGKMRGIADAGSTRAYIGITKQRELPIFYPSIDLQVELADQLDNLSTESTRLEAIYDRKVSVLDELRKSLLHEAFSGRL